MKEFAANTVLKVNISCGWFNLTGGLAQEYIGVKPNILEAYINVWY